MKKKLILKPYESFERIVTNPEPDYSSFNHRKTSRNLDSFFISKNSFFKHISQSSGLKTDRSTSDSPKECIRKNQTIFIKEEQLLSNSANLYNRQSERNKMMRSLKRYDEKVNRSPLKYREQKANIIQRNQLENEIKFLPATILRKDRTMDPLEQPPVVEKEQKWTKKVLNYVHDTEPPDKRRFYNKNAERQRQVKLKFQRQELEWLTLIDHSIKGYRNNI